MVIEIVVGCFVVVYIGVVDVGDLVFVWLLFDDIECCFGWFDFFVNNVGFLVFVVLFDEFGFEDWSCVVFVNLMGVFFCI